MGTSRQLSLSPLQVLLYFTLVNSLIYLDRGVISVPFTQATLTALAEAMDLSASKAGALGSVFILGFMVSSPIFAYCAQIFAAERLMACGLVIWSAATLTAGLSLNYWMLLIARVATGVGEASFVCLAPPIILDTAPPAKKTVIVTQLWVSIFYSAMMMGYALGFIYGHETMALIGTWRSPFLIEAGAMAPLILIALFLKIEGSAPVESSADHTRVSLSSQLRALSNLPVYLLAVSGSAAYAFTVGGLGFWGNSIVQQAYGVSARTAVMSLGCLTVFCGVVATVVGSLYMDKLLAQAETYILPEADMRAVRTEIACRLSFYSITSGAVIGTASACFSHYNLFLSALGLSPVGMAIMSSVPTELRGQANAMSVFLLHLLGDFPSPYIVGVVSQFVAMRWGFVILMSWLFFGVLAWAYAWVISVNSTQRRVILRPCEAEIEEEKLLV